MLDFVHSVFYGDYGFVAWTLVLIPFILSVTKEINHIIKNRKKK